MLAVAARETSKIRLGHFVTNPGTRDPTVLASAYATLHDLSNGRMAMGIGRGDSAVRYIGRQPMKVAEFERLPAVFLTPVSSSAPPCMMSAARVSSGTQVSLRVTCASSVDGLRIGVTY